MKGRGWIGAAVVGAVLSVVGVSSMNTFIPIYGKCFAPTPCGNIVIIVIFQKTKVLL